MKQVVGHKKFLSVHQSAIHHHLNIRCELCRINDIFMLVCDVTQGRTRHDVTVKVVCGECKRNENGENFSESKGICEFSVFLFTHSHSMNENYKNP
jgi:hypothetical protein